MRGRVGWGRIRCMAGDESRELHRLQSGLLRHRFAAVGAHVGSGSGSVARASLTAS
jgi:hypothetical protein